MGQPYMPISWGGLGGQWGGIYGSPMERLGICCPFLILLRCGLLLLLFGVWINPTPEAWLLICFVLLSFRRSWLYVLFVTRATPADHFDGRLHFV